METNEMYRRLGILKVTSLYKYNIFKFLKQLMEGRYPEFYNILLRPYLTAHHYETRGSMFRHPPLVSEVERRYLSHQLIIMYENLPPNIMNNNLRTSLRMYKFELLQNQ